MGTTRQDRITEFLREKHILSDEATQWVVRFDRGRGEMVINDLFSEFVDKEVDRDKLSCILNNLINCTELIKTELAHLDIDNGEISECMEDILNDIEDLSQKLDL